MSKQAFAPNKAMSRSNRSRIWSVLMAALFLTVSILPGRAADITARIRGTVTDAKGAVIPNVAVTATNTATGVSFPAKSDSKGLYEFLQLPVGTYNISAQAPGFQTFAANGITLTISQVYDEPVQLQVGSEAQTVTVQASAVQVDTTNMQLNNVVGSQQIVDLPLIGRDFTQLEQILPGVQASSDRFGSFSANGAQTQQSSFLINGTDTNDLPLNTISFRPSLDAIQEFNLITSSLNPEYSRNSGAIVSATIKNGTNHFHGDAFEFYRDTFLNTHNFFQQTAPKYHQNLFGGTIGGPVFRDKLFFFASYQGNRTTEPQTNPIGTNTVYSAAQRAGDFSGTTFSSNPIPGTIVIPGCAPGSTFAACFATGQVPVSAFNPVAVALTNKYVPLPNSSANRYIFNPTTSLVQDQGIARIDYSPTSKDQLWGVAIFQHAPSSDVLPFTGATLPGFGDVNTSEIHQFAASYSRVFNPTTLNEFQLHYTRFNYGAVTPAQVQLPSSVGFAITPQNPSVAGLPRINVGSNFQLGFSSNGPQPRIDQNYQLDDNFSKTVGRHSLKFGYDGRRFNVNNPFFSNNNGTFGFSDTNPAGSGSALLDFLLGIPNTYGQSAGGRIDAYAFEHYVYGQDTWKVRDNLTLTYGAGYQIDTALHNRQYKGEGVTCFIPGQQSRVFPTAPVGLNYPTDPGCNDASGAVTAWKDIGPRFGFAFSPDLGPFSGGNSHKLSIRGGYGIYFNRSEEETSLNNLGDPPFGLSSGGAVDYGANNPSFINPFQDLETGAVYPNKFPGTFASPGQPVDFTAFEPFSLSQYNHNFRVPYSQNFQLSIERELPSNVVMRVSYVGALGRHEQIAVEGNPITQAGHDACLASSTCITRRNTQSLRYPSHSLYGNSDVFPSVGLVTTEGSSNYNALEVSATKGFTHGLIFQASYTLSHSLDDASNYEDAGYGGTVRGYNQYDKTLNYGNSGFDARHRFVFSPVYIVPGFGPHFLSPITKGWQVNGIVTLATGFPYDISYGGFGTSRSLWCSSSLTFYACPDVPVQIAPLQRQNPRNAAAGSPWFNPTSSFVAEPFGTFGNVGRYKYHGPGINNTDINLAKNIYLGSNEARYIQLRLESYNVFNHTQFDLPDGNFSDSTFGLITGAKPGRQTQLAAKFYF